MTEPDSDSIVVRDASGRRRFMRAGTALLLAGGSLAAGRPVLAADCDRAARGGGDGEDHKQAVQGSDSDSGSNADPAGCGRRRHDAPKISRAVPPRAPATTVTVAKVRASS